MYVLCQDLEKNLFEQEREFFEAMGEWEWRQDVEFSEQGRKASSLDLNFYNWLQ